MSDDLAARLRNVHAEIIDSDGGESGLMLLVRQAADEVTRLRAEVAALKEDKARLAMDALSVTGQWIEATGEVVALREQLAKQAPVKFLCAREECEALRAGADAVLERAAKACEDVSMFNYDNPGSTFAAAVRTLKSGT